MDYQKFRITPLRRNRKTIDEIIKMVEYDSNFKKNNFIMQ